MVLLGGHRLFTSKIAARSWLRRRCAILLIRLQRGLQRSYWITEDTGQNVATLLGGATSNLNACVCLRVVRKCRPEIFQEHECLNNMT